MDEGVLVYQRNGKEGVGKGSIHGFTVHPKFKKNESKKSNVTQITNNQIELLKIGYERMDVCVSICLICYSDFNLKIHSLTFYFQLQNELKDNKWRLYAKYPQ
jgi:hypothetical protein